MTVTEHMPVWTTMAPSTWPAAPVEMTVTTLLDIEACPRAWALSAAHYPALWAGHGYPPPIQLGSLAGTVIHLAIAAITRGLIRAGCRSVEDPAAIQVMKELGGFTGLLLDCIERVRMRLAESPRAEDRLEFVVRTLCARVPDLRARMQTMLRRVRLPQSASPQADGHVSKGRGPLVSGAFSEIELHAREIGWKGKADLLTISPEACEITDFKSGESDDGHQFQIQAYALLWSRDVQLNPHRRRADRLVLAYGTSDVEIPAPTAAGLDALEREIVARCNAAREAISRHPPEAQPAPSHCRYCGVRHLCDEYWTAGVQSQMAEDSQDRHLTDLEVTITGSHGPSSWDGVAGRSPTAQSGQSILLRADKLPFALHPGRKVRLLAIRLGRSDDQFPETEPSVTVATVGTATEAFIVSE